MSLLNYILVLIASAAYGYAFVHDDIAQCGLHGIYKSRQNVLLSPNYPHEYAAKSCWDYVVRSPYRCPTKFHVQFLEFLLEPSINCTHDYLAIGINSDENDMEILCGQVVGIKKYNTPDGVLRLRFYAGDAPWTTGKGFKLLVTRLACEYPDVLRDLKDNTDTVVVPPALLNMPVEKQANLLRNLSLNEQYQSNVPWQVPAPCPPTQTALPVQQPYNDLPNFAEQWQVQARVKNTNEELFRQIEAPEPVTQTDSCCLSSFSQKHFYLSSPGFPRTVLTALLPTQQRDCQFELEKYSPGVCRLRIVFKFFDFGQLYTATEQGQNNLGGVLGTSDTCSGDFIEIDGIRFCGCRTGFITTIRWDLIKKLIRMRMGFSGIASNGFLLELTQEECTLLPTDNVNNVVNTGVPVLGGQSVLSDALPQQQTVNGFYGLQQRPLYPSAVNYQPVGYNQFYNPYWNRAVFPQAALIGYTAPIYPQYRQSRHAKYKNEAMASQPAAVVETNSTRKEFYYLEGENNQYQIKAERRLDDNADIYEPGVRSQRISLFGSNNRCAFGTGEIFRLLIDPLWVRKPICIAPQRRLLGNFFG